MATPAHESRRVDRDLPVMGETCRRDARVEQSSGPSGCYRHRAGSGLAWRVGPVWVLGAGVPFSFEPGLSRAGTLVISAPARPVLQLGRPATARVQTGSVRSVQRPGGCQHCHLSWAARTRLRPRTLTAPRRGGRGWGDKTDREANQEWADGLALRVRLLLSWCRSMLQHFWAQPSPALSPYLT